MGEGLVSETKVCDDWELDIQITDYKLVDNSPSSKNITLPNTEKELLDEVGRWNAHNSKIVAVNPQAAVVTFRIFDTPGLDDSDGDDAKNIIEVVGRLNRYLKEDHNPRIHGVLFLTSCTSAYSKTFQQLFRYYQRCMPDLFSSVIIVNTKFSIDEWEGKRRRMEEDGKIDKTEASRSRILSERRSDFQKHLTTDPPQWLLDSKPSPTDNLELLFSLNATMDLLRVLAAMDPMKFDSMKYEKMAGDISVDQEIIMRVQSKMYTMTKFRDLLVANASLTKENYIKDQEAILLLKHQIESLDKQILEVDHDSIITLPLRSTPSKDDLSWLTAGKRIFSRSLSTRTLEVEEPYEIYNVQFLNNDKAEWKSDVQVIKESSYSYVGTYQASWGRFPLLYASPNVRSSIKYIKKISEWKQAKLIAEMKLDSIETKFEMNTGDYGRDQEVEELLLGISQCREVIEALDCTTIPIENLDEAARARYKKKSRDINDHDVLEAINSLCPPLAERWKTI